MQTMTTCNSRLIRRNQTLVLTPVSGSWGSLETDRLARLQSDLAEAIDQTESLNVVIDLSTVTRGGSGLLRDLFHSRQRAIDSGMRFAVCGDTKGLIRLSGWETLMNLHDDLWTLLSREMPSVLPAARELPLNAPTALPVAT